MQQSPVAEATPHQIETFIARWEAAERAERTNYQLFLAELCDLLGLPRPEPAQGGLGAYRFERSVTHRHDDDRQTTRRIDLYKRDCFILEAKQGANGIVQQSLFGLDVEATHRQTVRNSPGWQQHMLKARFQAQNYVKDLPPDEASPPFLIVCDVGFCFDIYADFSGTGRHYMQFPDARGFRLYMADLRRPEIRERLTAIWQAPHALDPARRRTEVTREIAVHLAEYDKVEIVSVDGRWDELGEMAGTGGGKRFVLVCHDAGIPDVRTVTLPAGVAGCDMSGGGVICR